jgi:hypothetical protein
LVAITRRPTRLRLPTNSWVRLSSTISSLALAAAIGWLAHFGLAHPWLVGVAIAVVGVVELAGPRRSLRSRMLPAVPMIVAGASAAALIALSPRALTQIGVGLAYAIWHSWRQGAKQAATFTELLIVMAVMFEAIFLSAAIWWHVPSWIWLVTVWAASYGLVYENLTARGERLARVLAATWSLIAVEVSWVFTVWLVTYVLFGSYVIVPQAALILTGLAYCFGGIYMSQRQQALTRARLAEYLMIALLLVVIVASSTPWRGTL